MKENSFSPRTSGGFLGELQVGKGSSCPRWCTRVSATSSWTRGVRKGHLLGVGRGFCSWWTFLQSQGFLQRSFLPRPTTLWISATLIGFILQWGFTFFTTPYRREDILGWDAAFYHACYLQSGRPGSNRHDSGRLAQLGFRCTSDHQVGLIRCTPSPVTAGPAGEDPPRVGRFWSLIQSSSWPSTRVVRLPGSPRVRDPLRNRHFLPPLKSYLGEKEVQVGVAVSQNGTIRQLYRHSLKYSSTNCVHLGSAAMK